MFKINYYQNFNRSYQNFNESQNFKDLIKISRILSKFQWILSKCQWISKFQRFYQNFKDFIKISMDLIKISMNTDALQRLMIFFTGNKKKQRFSDFLIFCLLVSTCEFTIFSSYLEYFVGRKLIVPMAILEAKYDFRLWFQLVYR